MPPRFVLGPEGSAELVNYRARQNYFVVDRLFAAAELRLGGEHQQKVRIRGRACGRARTAPLRVGLTCKPAAGCMRLIRRLQQTTPRIPHRQSHRMRDAVAKSKCVQVLTNLTDMSF